MRAIHGFGLFGGVLLASGLAAPAASALDRERFDYQGAAGVCQPALPAHGANLRAQPLVGLTNNAGGAAYVTCSFRTAPPASGRGVWRLTANVANYGSPVFGVAQCTMVSGLATGPSTAGVTYNPREIGVPPGQARFLAWTPFDVVGTPASIAHPSVMCVLAPGMSLQFIGIHYDEPVGS